MAKRWPALSPDEIRDNLVALGCQKQRTRGSHETWLNPENGKVGDLDAKWDTVTGPDVKWLIETQLRLDRVAFYGATRRTAKKLR